MEGKIGRGGEFFVDMKRALELRKGKRLCIRYLVVGWLKCIDCLCCACSIICELLLVKCEFSSGVKSY